MSIFQPPYWKYKCRYLKKISAFLAHIYSGKVTKAFVTIPSGFRATG